ncbi:hypothetical protein MKZ38_005731 [Zalerion maritima]|uniref:Uncharacterized protein n=1 Tax=Zalerion maritima TaxID=339359 RepID=A0AAD5WQ62_9PEZI|nr:hypothetical protein MKZ38_005731 [Zalerion maritima]
MFREMRLAGLDHETRTLTKGSPAERIPPAQQSFIADLEQSPDVLAIGTLPQSKTSLDAEATAVFLHGLVPISIVTFPPKSVVLNLGRGTPSTAPPSNWGKKKKAGHQVRLSGFDITGCNSDTTLLQDGDLNLPAQRLGCNPVHGTNTTRIIKTIYSHQESAGEQEDSTGQQNHAGRRKWRPRWQLPERNTTATDSQVASGTSGSKDSRHE